MSSDLSRSANSSGGQRSKRSFNNNNNSTSSNRSNNSNDSNKKKKISQKTLGVAWGANSLSSSRSSSFRKSPFSDFGRCSIFLSHFFFFFLQN
jgi:DNA repair protein REV1